MLYLLDADVLITADSSFYPLQRFPVFWEWLAHVGGVGTVKIPREQYEEVTIGKGQLVDWLNDAAIRKALLFEEDANPDLVSSVTLKGYGDLDDTELEKVGRDPFLISYGLAGIPDRTVVTLERSAPSKQRANRKVPDVCADFKVPCCDLFKAMNTLDFTTNWKPK